MGALIGLCDAHVSITGWLPVHLSPNQSNSVGNHLLIPLPVPDNPDFQSYFPNRSADSKKFELPGSKLKL
ncbi:hypothetical protein V6Z11_A10G099200 [Gossypium hirsutum]